MPASGLADIYTGGDEILCPLTSGPPGVSDVNSTIAAQLNSNQNNYWQINLQNLSNGISASSDYVVTADQGTALTHYADFGINNSNGGSAPFVNSYAAYLYSTDNEFDIGALGTSGVVNVYTTGGTASPVLAATFDAAQSLTVTGYVKWSGQKVVSTPFSVTNSIVLANVTGLSVNVLANKNYVFYATLYTTSNVAGGVQAAVGGTCTASTIVYEASTQNGGSITQSRSVVLAGAVGAVTAVTAARIDIEGTIFVSTAGTLTIQFAQNASNASASTVLSGSSFIVQQIN